MHVAENSACLSFQPIGKFGIFAANVGFLPNKENNMHRIPHKGVKSRRQPIRSGAARDLVSMQLEDPRRARVSVEEEKPMTESEIRQRVADYVSAINAKDIDLVSSFFAPSLVSFDLEPPLLYTGADNKRQRWAEGFAAYDSINYEVRKLHVTTQGELALVHGLSHFKGTQPGGHVTDTWVRWTACFRRVAGVWLILHDHVSVPADLPHARAVLDLVP
jgi:ketosteroid isomerase-like protein